MATQTICPVYFIKCHFELVDKSLPNLSVIINLKHPKQIEQLTQMQKIQPSLRRLQIAFSMAQIELKNAAKDCLSPNLRQDYQSEQL